MKKLINIVFIFCLVLNTQAKTITETTSVHFDTDKFILKEQETISLQKFIKDNRTDLEYQITIKGHTDNIGNISYNNELSRNRANAVKDYLINLGVPKELITLDFFGELVPEKPNSTDKNREVNRRVEVKLTTYRFDNLSELEEALQTDNKNTFVINPTKENIVKGKNGIKVLIQPNTFTYVDGTPVKETVKFELTEALGFQDFIASGLITKTTNDLLETGGMLKLEATTVTGKPVVARKDNPMVISVPTDNRKEGMELFASDKGDTWVARNQRISPQLFLEPKGFPVMKETGILFPKFKYNGPKKPLTPRKPYFRKEPNEPNIESYIRPIKWYYLGKKKIRARQESAYNAAIVIYDKRMVCFERTNKNLPARKEAYEEQLCMYQQDVEQWEANRAIQFDFKKSTEYKAAEQKHVAAYEKNLAAYKLAVKEWREEYQKQMTAQGAAMDKLGITDNNAMDNYVFAFNNLQWINVDRFYHLEESQKETLVMKTDKIGDERVLVMFNNIRSMLSMSVNPATNTYFLNDFPKMEPAVIFSYKVENGKPYMCMNVVDGSNNYQLEYEPTSFLEISAILKSFENNTRKG